MNPRNNNNNILIPNNVYTTTGPDLCTSQERFYLFIYFFLSLFVKSGRRVYYTIVLLFVKYLIFIGYAHNQTTGSVFTRHYYNTVIAYTYIHCNIISWIRTGNNNHWNRLNVKNVLFSIRWESGTGDEKWYIY